MAWVDNYKIMYSLKYLHRVFDKWSHQANDDNSWLKNQKPLYLRNAQYKYVFHKCSNMYFIKTGIIGFDYFMVTLFASLSHSCIYSENIIVSIDKALWTHCLKKREHAKHINDITW